MKSFIIKPDTEFSLSAAADFGFGYNVSKEGVEPNTMQMAFALDGYKEQAAAFLRQKENGDIEVESLGTSDIETLKNQIRRILSLDHDGKGWLAVGKKDPVIGSLQRKFKGLRPVLFSSPYEGAAWSILSHRRHRGQAAKIRQAMAERYGKTFTLDGKKLTALPLPEKILHVKSLPGVDPHRLERLHRIARAALDGELDASKLRNMDPDAAMAKLQELPGIGHFYGGLILIRSSGAADILPMGELRTLSYIKHYYNMITPVDNEKLKEMGEKWKPFRTWAVVLIRVAGDRAHLPFTK